MLICLKKKMMYFWNRFMFVNDSINFICFNVILNLSSSFNFLHLTMGKFNFSLQKRPPSFHFLTAFTIFLFLILLIFTKNCFHVKNNEHVIYQERWFTHNVENLDVWKINFLIFFEKNSLRTCLNKLLHVRPWND